MHGAVAGDQTYNRGVRRDRASPPGEHIPQMNDCCAPLHGGHGQISAVPRIEIRTMSNLVLSLIEEAVQVWVQDQQDDQ